MIFQILSQVRSDGRVQQAIARLMVSRIGSAVMNFAPVAWTTRRLTRSIVRRQVQQARTVSVGCAQAERFAGTGLQARLEEIVHDVVEVFGYTSAMIATYEQGDSLPIRAIHFDTRVVSLDDIARWEQEISRFCPPGHAISLTDPDVARVFVFREEYQQNLGVQATRKGVPIVSTSLYDLFTPIIPPASKPLIAGIQQAIGVQQAIAVPFFLEVTTDGQPHKEIAGNLFALKSSTINDNDIMVLSAFGRQAAASILSERRRLQIEVAQDLTYQMQTFLQDETQILRHIAEGVVKDLGYVGCGVATYEPNGSLPVRALYVDPTVASIEQIYSWEAEISQLEPSGRMTRITDSTIARVFVHDPVYADNLSVRAARTERPVVSDRLYDLFRPIAPPAAIPLVAGIQQALGVQQLIAVPFFLDVFVDGQPRRELIGNLFAVTRSQQFSSGEIALLEAFAQQAAVAIRNARLYQHTEDRRLAAQIFGKMAFSATASVHALRNHVGVMRGNLQLLTMLEMFPAEERNELLKNLSRPVFEHLERIVDILDTLHEPWQQTHEGPAHVNACLFRGVKKADAEDVAGLFFDLDDDLPEVDASPDMLAEAFKIVFKYALRATEGRGTERRIEVQTARSGDAIAVTVRDNGNGLPPELVDTIFEIRRQHVQTGIGFGLYWTKEYIEGLGGTLNVTSSADQGTTFRASIPLSRRIEDDAKGTDDDTFF